MKQPPASGKLPLGRKIIYGLGDWGGSATSTIFIFFFSFFLSDVARLPLQLSGLVLLVGGIWDAVNDPLIGVLADRVRTRWGRRRPFFLFDALPLAITFTMLWWVPQWGDLARAAWFALAYVLFDTCFTLMTVPYGALTAELTEDYDERTDLTGWRMALNLLGGLMAAFFVPVIVGAFTRQATGYFVAAAGFGLLAVVPYLMLFFTTKERFAATAPPRESLLASFVATLKNRTFRYIAAIYLLSWVTVNLVASLLQYYVTWWVRIPDQLEFVLVVVQGAAIACIPLIVLLSGRLGKRGAYIVSAGWWAAVMLGLAVIPATAHTFAYVLAGLAGFGVAGAQVIPWSMVPDVIEADEMNSGRRREGAYYGVVAFIQKSGTAFMLAIVQWVLALTGYRPGEAQPGSALLAIRLMIGVAPALLLGLSMIVAWRSPLGRKEHEAMRAALEKRRAATARAAARGARGRHRLRGKAAREPRARGRQVRRHRPDRYRAVPGWGLGSDGHRPGGVLPGCGADVRGNVYVSRRSPPAILVFSTDGRLLGEWGRDVLANPHCVTVTGDHVWVTDTQDHTVRTFTLSGALVMTLGTPGNAGAPGAPFNRPTGVWVAPDGCVYVSDGYGQQRVHRFSEDGTLMSSWGEHGQGPGQFTLPHHVWGDGNGTIFVCDRESGRIQLFDGDGAYRDELSARYWPGLLWPNAACVDPSGALVVAEAGHRISIWERTEEPIRSLIATPASRWRLLARWGDVGGEPGQFLDCPHGLCVDHEGSIYVTEVPDTPDRITKFERV